MSAIGAFAVVQSGQVEAERQAGRLDASSCQNHQARRGQLGGPGIRGI